MTKEEEIEKAAIEHASLVDEAYRYAYRDGFLDGAKWADEHPISVWHDASEEPEIGSNIIAVDKDGQWWDIQPYHSGDYDGYGLEGWSYCIINYNNIQKWAYIDELLPKE